MKKVAIFRGVIVAISCMLVLIIVGMFLLNYHRTIVVLNGPSMEPTIHSGQKVRVHKYPTNQTPQRGDVVELISSNSMVKQYAKSGNLIHRVIALPGERITISNNIVTVYNAQHPDGFNPDTNLSSGIVTSGNVDLTLASGTYYMMGDNRPNALDSRAIGPIPLADIIGKVTYKRLYSIYP